MTEVLGYKVGDKFQDDDFTYTLVGIEIELTDDGKEDVIFWMQDEDDMSTGYKEGSTVTWLDDMEKL